MACNPNTLLSDGAGFQALGERDQQIVIAQLLCDISTGGASGSAGNYAGGQPDFTPTSAFSIAVDTSNGHVWMWYSSAWH